MGKHTEWRKLAKKLRRKRLRQATALARHKIEEQERLILEQSPAFLDEQRKLEEQEQFEAEEEAKLAAERHAQWLAVEEEAQRQWRELQKKLQAAREERARQNALIKLEWEREQQRLTEIKEQKEREREENERQQQLLKDQLENFIANGGDTPEHLKVVCESNPNKPSCPFFQKTSACRFRDLCSRNHIRPGVSRILLIPNFYSHYSLEQSDNEHGDSSLEFESNETYSHFKEFFFDVLPELERCGRIRQFKVCSNHEPHLRGNVYVEYGNTREAVKSYQVFNGRWYGGKQLSVEFSNIQSWKAAICGLHFFRRCPKGNSCNFLHVFRNPNNLFQSADRDEHRSSPSADRSERREWRWSESPERIALDDRQNKMSSRRSRCYTDDRFTNGSKRIRRSRSGSREHRRKDRRKSKSRSNERNRRKEPSTKYSKR